MIVRHLATVAAVGVILLAIAVGAFRLLLPQLPAYEREIKGWAQDALGLTVDFSRLDARWGLQGPELTFFDAQVGGLGNAQLLAVQRASVGVSLSRLIRNRELLVDQFTLAGTDVLLERRADGSFAIQQQSLDPRAGVGGFDLSKIPPFQVLVRDSRIRYVDHTRGAAVWEFGDAQVELQRKADRVLLTVEASLPEALGSRLIFSAEADLDSAVTEFSELETGPWRIVTEASDIDLAGWARLLPVASPFLPDEGRGDVSVWVEFAERAPVRGTLQVALDGVVLPNQRVSDRHGEPYESVRAVAEWARDTDTNGWRIGLTDLAITRTGQRWPTSNAVLKLRLEDDEPASVDLSVGFVRLQDLAPVAELLPEEDVATLWRGLDPEGDLRNVSLSLQRMPAGDWSYTVEAGLQNVGIAAYKDWPGIRGVSADVRADPTSGSLDLSSTAVVLDYPGFFAGPIGALSLSGIVVWRQGRGGLRVVGDDVAIDSPDFAVRSSLELTLPADGSSPVLEIDAGAVGIDAVAAKRYLPVGKMRPRLVRWLQQSVQGGEIPSARLSFFGPIRAFPFDNGEGQFSVTGRVENGRLQFAPGWTTAENIAADVAFTNARLDGRVLGARILNHTTRGTAVSFADLRTGVMTVNGSTAGPLQDVLDFLKNTPVTAKRMGGRLSTLSAPSGRARVALDLVLPLKKLADYELRGTLTLEDGELALQGLAPTFTALNGDLALEQNEVSGDGITGQLLGAPVVASVTPLRAADYRSQISWSGPLDRAAVERWLPAGLAGRITGSSEWRVEVLLPVSQGDADGAPTRVKVASDLAGMGLDLPPPFAKERAELLSMAAEFSFGIGSEAGVKGHLGAVGRFQLGFAVHDGIIRFSRGNLRFGDRAAALPSSGLVIDGQLPTLTVDDWMPLFAQQGAMLAGVDVAVASDLDIAELGAFGQDLGAAHLVVSRGATDWTVQVASEPVTGRILIPARLADRPQLVLDMERLRLVTGTGAGSQVDPRKLPGALVVARDFALGDRELGELNADISAEPLGLSVNSFATDAGSYAIKGSGRWTTRGDEQSTRIALTLTTTDIAASLEGLGSMQGMLDGSAAQLTADVSWDGGPTADWTASVAGEVSLSMDDGSVYAIEPGAGRVVGLMSIAALPRRLALDFRDVFQKGLRFDKVRGSFLLIDGDAYTNNLKLEGPVAEIGIVGRVGLKDRDYQQQAVVTAEAGKMLPAVGGILAGPGVGAALLLFTQIFKEPLKGMGRASYCVTGSWDEPSVERLTPAELAEGPLCVDLPPEPAGAVARDTGAEDGAG
jgi:uncharacterized protein (TIGR02099 family)